MQRRGVRDGESEFEAPSRGVSDRDSGSSAPITIVLQSFPETSTPTVVVHRSSKITRSLQRYSPTLNYILLTENAES